MTRGIPLSLEERISRAEIKIGNIERTIGALEGSKQFWMKSLKQFKEELNNESVKH